MEDIEGVERVEFVDGERDFIAGQRDRYIEQYDLHLDDETAAQVEEEQTEGVEGDPFSDTLQGIRNEVELELGCSPGEYEDGVLQVSADYDAR